MSMLCEVGGKACDIGGGGGGETRVCSSFFFFFFFFFLIWHVGPLTRHFPTSKHINGEHNISCKYTLE